MPLNKLKWRPFLEVSGSSEIIKFQGMKYWAVCINYDFKKDTQFTTRRLQPFLNTCTTILKAELNLTIHLNRLRAWISPFDTTERQFFLNQDKFLIIIFWGNRALSWKNIYQYMIFIIHSLCILCSLINGSLSEGRNFNCKCDILYRYEHHDSIERPILENDQSESRKIHFTHYAQTELV